MNLRPLTSKPSTSTSNSKPSSAKPKKKFNITTKTLFLTYPQNSTRPQLALDRIVEKWSPEWAVVAQEEHQDGNKHLHAVVRLKEPKHWSSPSFADFVAEGHGNYQSARGVSATLRYVRKAGNYVTYGEPPEQEVKGNRIAPTDRVAKMVLEGKTWQEIRQEEPGVWLRYKKNIQEMLAEEETMAASSMLSPWQPLVPSTAGKPWQTSIIDWLNTNLFKERKHKQPQLWIQAPPNAGKTYLATWLQAFCRIYYLPRTEDFYDDYFDENYDLVVWDEAVNTKPISWLNGFLEGSHVYLRKKGAQYLKKKNLPVLILSNFHPDEIWHKVPGVARDALHTRLQVVVVPDGQRINIDSVQSAAQPSPPDSPDRGPTYVLSDSDDVPRLSRKRAFIDLSDCGVSDEPPRKRTRVMEIDLDEGDVSE